MTTIEKLQSLYLQLDQYSSAGEDVVAGLRKEINNLELSYLKNEVLPQVSSLLGAMIKNLRCGIDCSIQYDKDRTINYSFCTTGGMLMVKDSIDANSCIEPNNSHVTNRPVGFTDNLFSSAGVEIPNSMNEDDWINSITSMKCMPYNGFTAPHKAIFLLTIIESIRCNFLKDNIIYPTKRIEETFRMQWNKYVPEDWPFTMNFYQPYVHLSGEMFYYIVKVNDRAKFDINKNWSATQASHYIKYGVLDKRLFDLLKDKQFANRVTDALLHKYLDCNKTIVSQSHQYVDKPDDDLPTRKSKPLQILSISAEHIHITEGNPTSMFVQFLNEIGPELVADMHINYLNGDLVSITPNPKYIDASKKLYGDYWVNTKSSTKTKIDQIKLISSNLGINVTIKIADDRVIVQNSDAISSRRRTLFSLNGNTPLNKRMTVLACVRQFMDFNPNIPFEVVERNFPPELQGSYGVVAKLSKVNSRILQGYDDNNRYFLDKDKVLKAKDGVEFVVCHQWGNQFHKFQEHIRKRFGWTLEEVE